jgi:hypothetical protein
MELNLENIVVDLVVEALKEDQRGLFNNLVKQWFPDGPSESQVQRSEWIFEHYLLLKGQNKLEPKFVEIRTFLKRFKSFNPVNLKKPKEFTYEQMLFIVGEFYELPTFFGNLSYQYDAEADLPEILRGRDLNSTKERIEASKQLWDGNQNLIFGEEGFRVYKINDRKTSISYGFYENHIANLPIWDQIPSKRHMNWCITWNESRNYWTSYRKKDTATNRTFYFIIDESKNPSKEKNPLVAQYYLCALQVQPGLGENQYRLTSIYNDGSDPIFTTQEILGIYPQLEGHIEMFTAVPFNQSRELGANVDEVDLINETPGDPHEFAIEPYRLKLAYINTHRPLQKKASWEDLDERLKKRYIDGIDSVTRMNELLMSEELFRYIKSIPEDYEYLMRQIEKYKLPLSDLIRKYIDVNYKVVYHGRKNDNIMIIQKKQASHETEYGIYDAAAHDWLEKDGLIYDARFTETDSRPFRFFSEEEQKKKSGLIITYQADNGDMFYAFSIGATISTDTSRAKVFILSKNQYHNLEDTIKNRTNEFKPEDADLGEMKKGL